MDDTICSSLQYVLSATPSVGTGTWSAAGVTFTNANDPASTMMVTAPGTYELVWTEDNGNGCIDSDTVNITLSDISFTDQVVTY